MIFLECISATEIEKVEYVTCLRLSLTYYLKYISVKLFLLIVNDRKYLYFESQRWWKFTWPNQDDRILVILWQKKIYMDKPSCWNMTKSLHRQTLTFEHDQKNNLYISSIFPFLGNYVINFSISMISKRFFYLIFRWY